MMFVVFDLDGTLARIEHRIHHVRNGNRNWDAFFAACPDDVPNGPVIETLKAHVDGGHRVEIWSGRSDQVRPETERWLEAQGIDPFCLTKMRCAGDYTPDVALKRRWLMQIHEDERPDAIYDDRARVVAMWREEGIPCFQVAPGDFDDESKRILLPTTRPLLTVMVGPTGAGKSRWVAGQYPAVSVVSSDAIRAEMCGDFEDQSRNDDVFLAAHRIAKARLECGLPVVFDATNLRQRDRIAVASLAPPGVGVRYVVVDRPLADKVRDGGWRTGIIHKKSGLSLIELHAQRFKAQLSNILAGDGLPDIEVVDLRQEQCEVAA